MFKVRTLAILAATAGMFRMSDADAAAPAPVEVAADVPPVTIEVPAEHESLFARIKSLLATGEQDVKDNIHAGIAVLEKMFGKKTEAELNAHADE